MTAVVVLPTPTFTTCEESITARHFQIVSGTVASVATSSRSAASDVRQLCCSWWLGIKLFSPPRTKGRIIHNASYFTLVHAVYSRVFPIEPFSLGRVRKIFIFSNNPALLTTGRGRSLGPGKRIFSRTPEKPGPPGWQDITVQHAGRRCLSDLLCSRTRGRGDARRRRRWLKVMAADGLVWGCCWSSNAGVWRTLAFI